MPKPVHIPYLERHSFVGDITLWVAFAIFLVSTVAFVGLGFSTAKKNRIFHHFSAVVALVATLSYYALATGSGYRFVFQGLRFIQGREVAVFRQVAYARFIDATLTTPLLLLELSFVAGLPRVDIAGIAVANEAMVITQLIASFLPQNKTVWGWYAFSWIFLIYIVWNLLWLGRQTSRLQASHIPGLYTGFSSIIVLLWVLYSVALVLSDATSIINTDVEIIVYAVLDVVAKAGFGFALVFAQCKHNDDHAGTMPDTWVEPRSHHNRIRLPTDE